MSDEVERTLCQLPSVFVYKAPTRTSAEGYRASNFPKDHMWAGKLRIVAKGRQASIILIDANTNAVFATCPYGEGAVERTVDSGRYFILRIVNAQGKHAYIGIAFNERNDAFDFNVALQEHDSECKREDDAAKGVDASVTVPLRDLSLKAGEKIKINVPKKKKDGEFPDSFGSTGGSSVGTVLPATGSKGSLLAPPGTTKVVSQPAASVSADIFGSFTSSSSAPADPFSSFGSDPFGQSDPFTASRNDPFALPNPADPFGSFTSATSISTSVSGSVSSQPKKSSEGPTGDLLDLNF